MWRLLDLGPVDGYTMTNLYEAVGREVSGGNSPNTVILNHPTEPFVNIGYHQLLEKEINVEYAKEKGFKLVRRTIGGGAILDGPWEQDYFLVINRNSPECPATIPDFYEKFTKPAIYALKTYGLDARLRRPNDLTVNGKKISGNGAITIDKTNVLAGDILITTPADLMSQIIKAPSEKFKDKLFDTMSQWLTSLENELGKVPTREDVKSRLVEGFKAEVDEEIFKGVLSEKEKNNLSELIAERSQLDWIYSKDNELRHLVSDEGHGTRVKEGVTVLESIYKAGKLVRVTVVVDEGKISGISISGDFFTQPFIGAVSKLQDVLKGVELDETPLRKVVSRFFSDSDVRMMGVTPDDLVAAVLKTKEFLH
jgi:lipoate-protein ligase A